jgi:hypothetical protein
MPVVLQEVAEETPVGKPGLLMYVLLNTTTLPDVHWFTEAEIIKNTNIVLSCSGLLMRSGIWAEGEFMKVQFR